MELREFFTNEEIEAMKDRIVKETSLSYFVSEKELIREDGCTIRYKEVVPAIEKKIQQIVDKEIEDFLKTTLKNLIHGIVKDKISAATEKFTQTLCDQLDEITDKTNWYWSIR